MATRSVIVLAALVITVGAAATAHSGSDRTPPVTVDSSMTRVRALKGSPAPRSRLAELELVTVTYLGFDGRRHRGQIVVRRDLAREVAAIFRDLERLRFPIARVVPVSHYGWSDAASMAANNTSGFNYRRKPGQRGLSLHAFGSAVDINPKQNPYVIGRRSLPPGARHRPGVRGTIVDGPVVRAFTRRGWRWGGHFRGHKDWQHFDKPVRRATPRA